MIHRFTLLLVLGGLAPLAAEPTFLAQASDLLNEGRIDETATLVQQALATNPDDPDALVIQGTVVLYRNLHPRREDSIYRPQAEPAGPRAPALDPSGAAAIADWWKRVPARDPARIYLWGDLAQLTFRAGDSSQALAYAAEALVSPPDPEALQAAASVFLLNLDADRAVQALEKIPGNRSSLLYRGLEAWRLGKEEWQTPLKAYVADPGLDKTGVQLASFLIGPGMRDTEAGFLEALKTENDIPALFVRQKYVDRYPDKFLARLDLARSLSQFGSFALALAQYSEIDKRGLASSPDERLAVAFQQAWAFQASGRVEEASNLWEAIADSRDFYLRSAACWFLGQNATGRADTAAAKGWWSRVADEPARSKYAFWALEELTKLP